MSVIQLLDEKTINQIAAGEVIENPASVVKELVENSLDSGASKISIETKAGGRGYIKVADNGCGMSPEDLLLSLQQHATSKLREVEGLYSLGSLGFRGEALPSIASISKLTLHSSLDSKGGAQLKVEGGKPGPLIPSPRQKGTTVEVKSLFFNVPVRKKFQKSLGWDTGEIHKILTKFALCIPTVAFTWVNDEKVIFSFTEKDSFEERIKVLLGEEFAYSTLPVEHKQGSYSLSGLISRPKFHRPNRTGQYLFVNQRAVISSFVAKKILEGYETRIPTHRFPLFVLHLTLPPLAVDVNVHPQKKEIRLQDEAALAPFLINAVELSLEGKEKPMTTKVAFPHLMTSEPHLDYEISFSPPAQEQSQFIFPKVRVLAKIGHYLFMEDEEGMRIVDGKRAWEQIIFEELNTDSKKPAVQSLLLPIHLEFAGKEKTLLLECLETLNQKGISIRHFGGNTFIVDAIPSILESDEVKDLISIFLEEGAFTSKGMHKCLKRSIKSLEEGAMIVEKLFRCQNSNETPDGKMIHYLLSETELEKWFT